MIFLVLILAFNPSLVPAKNDLRLSDYRWKNRLVLTFSRQESSVDRLRQHKELLADKDGLLERDLLIFDFVQDKSVEELLHGRVFSSNDNIWRKFSDKDSPFLVVLIGKDGTMKLRRERVLSKNELFGIIDAMPMRRAEMQEQH
jgi:hypothetical protein